MGKKFRHRYGTLTEHQDYAHELFIVLAIAGFVMTLVGGMTMYVGYRNVNALLFIAGLIALSFGIFLVLAFYDVFY